MFRPLACLVALLLAAPPVLAQDEKEEKGDGGDKPLKVIKGKLTDDDPKDKVVKPSPSKPVLRPPRRSPRMPRIGRNNEPPSNGIAVSKPF